MKKQTTDFKPNYAVEPIEHIKEMCLYQIFGADIVKDFEKGITEKNVIYLSAMFPYSTKKFWLNLQKNYDDTTKRLTSPVKEPSIENDGVCTEHGEKACILPHVGFDSKKFMKNVAALKEPEKKSFDDTMPFTHGQEGTHFACQEMMKKYGDKVGCCDCNKHVCKPMRKKKGGE